MSVNSDIQKLLNKGNVLNEALIQKYERQLKQSYLKALKTIREELQSIYQKYGVIDPKTEEKVLQFATMRGTKLQKLQKMIEGELSGMKDSKGLIKEAILKGHVESYGFTGFALERTLQTELGFSIIPKSELNAILYNPMDKIKWSTRNVANINKMTNVVRSEITRGVIEGKSYGEMAKGITEQLNIGASKAVRIVRTETGRAQEVARKVAIDQSIDYADEVGMKVQKIWDATLDNHTRPNHGNMDGKEADADGKFLFITMDGEHKYVDGPKLTDSTDDINCRCNLRLQFNNIPPKVRKDNLTKEVIPYASYNNWKQARGL